MNRRVSKRTWSFGSRNLRKKRRKDPEERAAQFRIIGIGTLFAICAVIVIGRAYHLQIKNGDRYQGVAKRQSVAFRKVDAKRGVISDRNGDELAISVDVDSIYAEPRRIKNPKLVAKQLSKVLDIDAKKLEQRLNSRLYFRYLKRRVSSKVSDAVRKLDIHGIGIRPEPKRFYSNRSLASHVLGFTNFESRGVAGIERKFNSKLHGRSYEVSGLRDALGNRVLSEGFVPHAALEGHDIRLTLDRNIQHAAELELKKAVESNDGESGVAIVMQPRTGDILALASYPDFNPNNLQRLKSEQQLNRAISMVYEPGSTMKLITIAAALEDKVIRRDETIHCENGKWKIGRRTIRDGNHKYGDLTLDEILKVSSNICSAKLGFKLGSKQLHKWIRAFGFGDRTGIQLPGELKGLIRPPERWRDIALANISFGQGLAVTPLQVVQATAALANDGVLVRPKILKSTFEKGGTEKEYYPEPPRRILRAEVAQELRRMMVGVTQDGGTAEMAAIEGFNVAGKTGTSQKIDPVTRAYSRSLYVASFVGFVPAEDPAAVVLVLVDEPKKSIYGGPVAGPAFKNIAMATLSSLGIFPDDAQAKLDFVAQMAKVAPLPGADLPAGGALKVPVAPSLSDSARALLGLKSNDNRSLKGSSPLAWDGDSMVSVQSEVLAPGRARMPNFAGLSPREVINRSSKVSCDLVFKGTGIVVKQMPAAGVIIRHGARCEVTLSPQG